MPRSRRGAHGEGTRILGERPEDRFYYLPPIDKNIFQPPPHKKRIGQIAEDAERNHIMDQVRHLDAAFYLPEMMLMMPKRVGTPPLLVDEVMPLFHLRDLREPARAEPRQRPELIFDELTGINAIPLRRRKDHKLHVGRCYSG